MKRKLWKKACFLLVAIMIFATTGISSAATELAFPLPENPTPAQVKATYYLNSDLFAEYAYVAHESPYKEYIKEIESEDTFEAEYLLWKADNLIECAFEGNVENVLFSEVGYYQTVVF